MSYSIRRTSSGPNADRRLRVLKYVIAAFVTLLAVRALWVQGIDAQGAAQDALNRLMNKPQTLLASRGTITDRNGEILAQSLPYVRVIADPYGIATNGIDRATPLSQKQKDKAAAAPAAIADILMTYLGGSADDYLGHLTNQYRTGNKPNQYEPIAANVPAYTYAKIVNAMNAGGWYGLSSEETPLRVYPSGTLASNVLGFVGSDGNGLAGFEHSQNAGLTGVNGQASYERGPYGTIPLGNNTIVPAIDGYTYQLTLDSLMQQDAQTAVQQALATSGADYGIAIMLDIKTGQVLAMADAPTFDNNAFSAADPAVTGNLAVQTTYEPGSVEKVITLAALVDQGLITPDTPVVVPGGVPSGGYVIRDDWAHGDLYLTARGVLAYSSNVGSVLLARQSTKTAMADYLAAFGLGKPTGIQLPGEGEGALGIVPDASMPDYQRDRIAFGQSISVTAMQEAAAIAAVVNGGVYRQPTIIDSVTDAKGRPVAQPPQVTRQVISPAASAAVLNMMESVTESDMYVKTRAIPGYTWAGKTGTAQRVDAATGKYQGTTASFIGVAPANDPQILVYVILDNPAGNAFGADVALPPARDLMMQALPHFGVAPTGNHAYTDPLTFEP